MPERRTVFAAARVSPAERADWLAKAEAAGVPLSDLLRQAMARTRTWTAPAVSVERERTVQIACIGNNLNQLARWANTYAERAEAVDVIAHLVAIEQAVAELARLRRGDAGARQVHRPRDRLGPRGGRLHCSANGTRPASRATASRSSAAIPTWSPPSPTRWSSSTSTPPA